MEEISKNTFRDKLLILRGNRVQTVQNRGPQGARHRGLQGARHRGPQGARNREPQGLKTNVREGRGLDPLSLDMNYLGNLNE